MCISAGWNRIPAITTLAEGVDVSVFDESLCGAATLSAGRGMVRNRLCPCGIVGRLFGMKNGKGLLIGRCRVLPVKGSGSATATAENRPIGAAAVAMAISAIACACQDAFMFSVGCQNLRVVVLFW